MRERIRVRGSLCQSRPSKRLELNIARQARGELIFVVASIGIVARQGSGLPVGGEKLRGTIAGKDRPDA